MKFTKSFLICIVLSVGACAYKNWEYVRIESSIPSSECKYKIQEACYQTGATCYNWYKKRATIYGANTVVISMKDIGQSTKSNWAGNATSSDSAVTALAEYYFCPSSQYPKGVE